MATPKQIHEELTATLATFKLEFGNPKHIAIVKEIQRLGVMNKEFEKEIESVKKLKALREDIRRQKSNILYMFKTVAPSLASANERAFVLEKQPQGS